MPRFNPDLSERERFKIECKRHGRRIAENRARNRRLRNQASPPMSMNFHEAVRKAYDRCKVRLRIDDPIDF